MLSVLNVHTEIKVAEIVQSEEKSKVHRNRKFKAQAHLKCREMITKVQELKKADFIFSRIEKNKMERAGLKRASYTVASSMRTRLYKTDW